MDVETGESFPVRQFWQSNAARFRPALVVEPATGRWPAGRKLRFRATTEVGGDVHEIVFDTLPEDVDTSHEVSLTLAVRENCAGCFPYPVEVTVFLPPGSRSLFPPTSRGHPQRPAWCPGTLRPTIPHGFGPSRTPRLSTTTWHEEND